MQLNTTKNQKGQALLESILTLPIIVSFIIFFVGLGLFIPSKALVEHSFNQYSICMGSILSHHRCLKEFKMAVAPINSFSKFKITNGYPLKNNEIYKLKAEVIGIEWQSERKKL
jgi:hypothetical protein